MRSIITRLFSHRLVYAHYAFRLFHLFLSVIPLLWVTVFYLHAWRGEVELGRWPVAFGDGPRPGDKHDSPNNMPDTDLLYDWSDGPAWLGLIGVPQAIFAWFLCLPALRLMSPQQRRLHKRLFVLSVAAWLVVILLDPGNCLGWMID